MKNFLNHKTNEQKIKENNAKIASEVSEKENYIKKYPLHYAASQGNLEKVKELLQDQAVEVDARDHNTFTPLHIAAGQNHWDIVIKLLQHDADPNAQDDEGSTPMHLAAQGNNLKILKCLVKNKYGAKKGDIDIVNDYDRSILHSAASGLANGRENWEILEWLLKRVNPDFREETKSEIKNILWKRGSSYADNYEKLLAEVKQEQSFIQQVYLPKQDH